MWKGLIWGWGDAGQGAAEELFGERQLHRSVRNQPASALPVLGRREDWGPLSHALAQMQQWFDSQELESVRSVRSVLSLALELLVTGAKTR